MCLVLFSWRQYASFPLVVMANRDEFYARPAAQADFWEDAPRLLAGKDLEGQGTWFGVTRSGRWATITNFRAPSEMRPDAPSRGHLVTDFLLGTDNPDAYLQRVHTKASAYNGFNLLVGTAEQLCHYANKEGVVRTLAPGLYGLSNHLLDTPWPKVQRGKEALKQYLQTCAGTEQMPEYTHPFEALQNRTRPTDAELPSTGVSLEWERVLSPMFIESQAYGTRCSTFLAVRASGEIQFAEQTYPNPHTPQIVSPLCAYQFVRNDSV